MSTNSCTADDVKILKSCEIAADTANYPTQALHEYRLNPDVDKQNSDMLNNIAPESAQFAIKAIDSVAGQTNHIRLTSLSDKRSEIGGLHSTLRLTTVHIVTNNNNEVTNILVKFDNSRVGLKSIQTSPY